MIGLYDDDDILITNLVQSAISKPDFEEIKHRTLDGSWHIQTIGTAGTILEVKVNLTLADKEKIDSAKRTTTPLKVIFDGKWYKGIIDGEINYDRRPFAEYPIFPADFVILINEEGVV